MIVVDANIFAYLLLPYECGPQADALFKCDPDWVAPILWRSEFRNLLELVRDSNCLAYDCEFIALAARLGTKVVTMDGKMLRESP